MFDTPRYSLSQVAMATGGAVNTLRAHLARGHWKLIDKKGDVTSDIPGRPHIITLRRALQIAVATDLIAGGIEPKFAYASAWVFSDEKNPDRPAGELFPQPDLTMLRCVEGGRGTQVVRLPSPATVQMFFPNNGYRRATIAVLNELVDGIRAALAR